MKINRRELGILSGGAAASMISPAMTQASMAAQDGNSFSPNAWHQRIKRIMQVNFTEKDPAKFDVDAWIDFLESVKCDCTFVSVSSPVVFFPTALPFFPKSRWLGDRDIFGECVEAAKRRGIRVLGRMSIDSARLEFAKSHPEWFRRTSDSEIVETRISFLSPPEGHDPANSGEYGRTCQFTDYYSDAVPKLMEEVMTRYDIDGVFTNGWPSSHIRRCYCKACQKIGDPNTEKYRLAYQERIRELWALYSKSISIGNKQAIYVGNLGGGIGGGDLDHSQLRSQAVWGFGDSQGRSGKFTPSWDASQQTRAARATFAEERAAAISTGAWTLIGDAWWRSVSANPPEVKMRLYQTLAAGGIIHHHWLGFEQGFYEDRRWQKTARDVLAWQAEHDAHFHNIASITDVALIASPRNNRLYKAPPGTETEEAYQGFYKILNEARIPFDVVLDQNLSPERIGRYSVLILPNIALMNDAQATQINDFAKKGGSVIATFETGLYDENGNPRSDFALSDLFDVSKAAPREGYGHVAKDGSKIPGPNAIQRIERKHPIVADFDDTNWIHGTPWRMPIRSGRNAILTNVPQYPVYPVESVFTQTMETDEPTMVAFERGGARLVYLAGDVDAGYWRTSAADFASLLTSALRWVTRDRTPLTVDGDGLLEIFGWRTEPGYAVHLVNHTNPDFRGGAFGKTYPTGEQKVTLQIGENYRIRSARLLHAGADLPYKQNGNVVELTVPSVDTYEVAALRI